MATKPKIPLTGGGGGGGGEREGWEEREVEEVFYILLF